ncbi:aminotransferase class I/II-fold pyridoxal phosphate-dependent enzyme [Rubrivivax albus]|uniref:DegT/DnrJ/EryC1/StrS aminotransferase family protein n=1 Tax=Rubrivivax albus TaxID=2499835 RepID=A0A3S2TMG1_9BURK|nr:aminotransferase class I/II-fold pyridoxal phosphate-dependent enzyme [Rubrivivax albus]RVT51286.1 DegT/DnrJ/EryC1/StrS aminotransferase family protein [Rubrivivax albus]
MHRAPLLCTTLDARTVAVASAGLDASNEVHDPAQVTSWEQRFARWLGAGHDAAVRGLGSGRAALRALVDALGLGEGDEVIVPAFTCRSVTNAIRASGASVVFADIETDAFGLDAGAVRRAWGPRVRAVLIQHSFGLPGRDLEALLALAKDRDVQVIEDCAHALGGEWRGRKLGTLGDAALFSFERGKMLSTIHGGMAVVHASAPAHRLNRWVAQAPSPSPESIRALLASVGRDFRQWCGGADDPALADAAARFPPLPRMWPEEFEGQPCPAYAERMAPVVAALAQVQFDRLDEVLARRTAQAGVWADWAAAEGFAAARAPAGSAPAWLRFPLWVDAVTKAAPAALESRLDVEVGLWFTTPEHPVPASAPGCPRGTEACARVVNLPTLLPPGHPWAAR